MPQTPEEMESTMLRNLEAKSGKKLKDWLAIVGKTGFSKHGEIVKHLKAEHGLTHGYANLVAHKALQPAAGSAPSGQDLIENQYAGPKAALRPIFDALMAAVSRFGKDVEVAPKKAYVSLRRSKQFALVQPSTASRVDVGINLKGAPPAGRLEASGSFNAMVTHRVRLASKADVDAELKKWLKQAYDAS